MNESRQKTTSTLARDVCYRAFELMHAKQFADAEKLLVGNMAKETDDASIALYHSVLGVLCKLKGEYKSAWKHYERAEKLLPNDPALKIISARLLIEQFSEYDQAIKKAKKVLTLIPDNPAFHHQAHCTMGLAYLKKGEKKRAVEALTKMMAGAFRGFITAQNIDFSLAEALLRRGLAKPECRTFFEQALSFAQATDEEKYIDLFQTMIERFDAEYGAVEDAAD